jgi:hypothetical protein
MGTKGLLLLSVLFFASACTNGVIYTRTTRPLVRNMNHTARASEKVYGNSQLIKEPISGSGVSIEWASHALGDVAKKEGLYQIHYADIETLSILGGIYRKKTLIVYGEKAPVSDVGVE